jgi:hypothetical protein
VGAQNLENAARSLLEAVLCPKPNSKHVQTLVADVERAFAVCLNTQMFDWSTLATKCTTPDDKLHSEELNRSEESIEGLANFIEELSVRDVAAGCVVGQTPAACAPCDTSSRLPLNHCRKTAEPEPFDGVGLAERIKLADIFDEQMASNFGELRERLELLRSCNDRADIDLVREHAAAIRQMAAHGGLQRLAGQAARMLAAERYVTRDMLDDAQRELDTTEALWRAVGWVV